MALRRKESLHLGLIHRRVGSATEEVLQIWPLTRVMSYDDVLRTILDIRNIIESCMDALLINLLPVENQDMQQDIQQNDSKLIMLLSETRNILESEAFRKVLKHCLDHTFLHLTTNLRASFESPSPTEQPGDALWTQLLNPSPLPLVDTPMAKFIPVVNKQFAFILDNNNNKILNSLSSIPQLQEYSLDLFKLSS